MSDQQSQQSKAGEDAKTGAGAPNPNPHTPDNGNAAKGKPGRKAKPKEPVLRHGALRGKTQNIGPFRGTVVGGVPFPNPGKAGKPVYVEFYVDHGRKESGTPFTATVRNKTDNRQIITVKQGQEIADSMYVMDKDGAAPGKAKNRAVTPRVNLGPEPKPYTPPDDDED